VMNAMFYCMMVLRHFFVKFAIYGITLNARILQLQYIVFSKRVLVCIGNVKNKGVSKQLQPLAQMHQRLDKLEKELTVIRKDMESSSKEINGNMKKVTDKLEELCGYGFVLQAKWKDDISRMKTEINMDLGVVRQEM